jgi:hypothetical protein
MQSTVPHFPASIKKGKLVETVQPVFAHTARMTVTDSRCRDLVIVYLCKILRHRLFFQGISRQKRSREIKVIFGLAHMPQR